MDTNSSISVVMIFFAIVLSTIRNALPLILGALGGCFSERSGVVNIALEGVMTFGAFAGAIFAFESHQPLIGIFTGALAGVLISSVYGLFVIQFRADQIVAGTAINLLAAGVTPFLSKIFYDTTSATPSLPLDERLSIWGSSVIAFSAVALAVFVYRKTPLGLRMIVSGENPEALASAGVSALKVRWKAIILSGICAGTGGAILSVGLSSGFSREMVAGRGYMALAALILGKWRPFYAALACLFFGFAESLQDRLQGVALWDEFVIPVQFIQILPYAVTLLLVAGFVGSSRPPAALGRKWS